MSYLSLNPRPVVDLCKLVGVCMCGLSSHGSNTCRLSNWLRFALDYNCEWLCLSSVTRCGDFLLLHGLYSVVPNVEYHFN